MLLTVCTQFTVYLKRYVTLQHSFSKRQTCEGWNFKMVIHVNKVKLSKFNLPKNVFMNVNVIFNSALNIHKYIFRFN